MSANLQSKEVVVSEIKDKFERAQSVVLIDYRGLTVENANQLRNECRKANVDYKVYKNTLIKRAIEGMNIDDLDNDLNGPTALAISFDDPIAPAKTLSDYIKKAEVMNIKSGVVNGVYCDAEKINTLAKLPPKEQLIAKALGTINAPLVNLVGVLSATYRNLVYALDSIAKQKAQ